MERTCEQCGTRFEAQRSTAQYCSGTCRKEAHRKGAGQGQGTSGAQSGVSPPQQPPEQQGHEGQGAAQPTPDPTRERREEAAKLRARAAALVEQQREDRGYSKVKLPSKEPALQLGPYIPTPEGEGRAGLIIHLRKRAAELEHPT